VKNGHPYQPLETAAHYHLKAERKKVTSKKNRHKKAT